MYVYMCVCVCVCVWISTQEFLSRRSFALSTCSFGPGETRRPGCPIFLLGLSFILSRAIWFFSYCVPLSQPELHSYSKVDYFLKVLNLRTPAFLKSVGIIPPSTSNYCKILPVSSCCWWQRRRYYSGNRLSKCVLSTVKINERFGTAIAIWVFSIWSCSLTIRFIASSRPQDEKSCKNESGAKSTWRNFSNPTRKVFCCKPKFAQKTWH